MRKLALVLALLPATALAEPLKIVAVTAPLADMAEALGGDAVTVSIPIPDGEDPMTFQPAADVVAATQAADLILLNGAGYAQWVGKVSLPRSKVVDTGAALESDFIAAAEVLVHSHGGEGEHAHSAMANTLWLDFDMASQQAAEIAAAIIRKAPDQKDAVTERLASLQADLKVLDGRATELAATLPDAIASHPRYEYLAHAYDIDIRALHWEAEDVPTEEQLAELDAMLAAQPAGLFIWELTPNPAAAKLVEQRGLTQIVFNPGDNTRGYLDLMRTNLDALAAIN